MPRGVTVNLASNSETSEKDLAKNVIVKTECNTTGTEEQVIHRKSARRRVARDIFLVFEEQPRRQGRGSNRKRSQIKSKFEHLRVQDPKTNTRARAGLLRDIKNEPKCCLLDPTSAAIDGHVNQKLPETQNPTQTETPNQSQTKTKTKAAPRKQKRVVTTKKLKSTRCGVKNSKATSTTATSSSLSVTAPATVNPIFLWAKQDDTRIVEVRCEDYDKRNRIRITKTTTGWRAIPRSDASTSRIVKFLQTPSSLMKLKREIYDSKLLVQQNDSFFEHPLDFYSNHNSIESNGLPPIEFESPNDLIHIGVNTFDENIDKDKNRYEELENNNDQEQSNNCNCDNVSTVSAPMSASTIQEDCTASIHSPDRLSENDSQSYFISDGGTKEIETITTNSDTYQTYTSELRLCPKTGLFFSSNSSKDIECNEVEANDSGIHTDDIDAIQCQIDSENAPSVSVDSVIESLNTDATNLKDLLDDADLLHDNDVNCDSELLDSLVKHGTTLITQTEILSNATSFHHKANSLIASPKDSIDEGIVDNMLPQILDAVSESHKCLSFNEAGEIEIDVANGEQLFQTLQNFTNAFERESQLQSTSPSQTPLSQSSIIENTNNILNPKAIETISMPLRNATSLTEGAQSLNAVASSPKDLSYKKNDENICRTTTSESHSQCAVSSSSDILLSPPHQNEVPNVESGTENMKNFILEQFINLNALNTLPNTTTKQQQSESINFGHQQIKQQQQQKNPDQVPSTEFIETVIIDDNSNDEPAKKKVCNKTEKKVVPDLNSLETPPPPPPEPAPTPTPLEEAKATTTTTTTTKAKANNIDGDPDPLTQLQLLLRNTQWKVPDPILVPKDRLGAVLASPAREIPLLITTRPELRLPEAFAYPHIIQNPNILVISMAQLEAILKNEMEMSRLQHNVTKKTSSTTIGINGDHEEFGFKNHTITTKSSQSKDFNLNTKCSYVENESNNSNSSMATDINAATLAVINQMLWLPYLGQWSQDLISTLKTPIGLPNQFTTNFLTPPYNHHHHHHHHTSFGLQHLDELYKEYIKQMPNSNTKLQENDGDATLAGFQASPIYLRAINALQNHVDMMLLQKLVQQQMPNFASSEQPSSSSSTSTSSSSSLLTPLPKKDQVPLEPLPFPFPETASKVLLKQQKQELQQQQQQQQLNAINNHQRYSKEILKLNSCTVDYKNIGDDVSNILTKNSNQQKSNDRAKTKPRLTCKSLSNLLEPDNRSSRTIPLINLTPEAPETGLIGSFSENFIETSLASNFPNTTFKQSGEFASPEFEKPRTHSHIQQTQFSNEKKTPPDLTHLQGHSHFNSGMNGVCNSQWNWTTVTATGE